MKKVGISAAIVICVIVGLLFLFDWVSASNRAGPIFTNSSQLLGGDTTFDLDLADVDDDGDLDLVAANLSDNRLWLNDGNGTFSDSGQRPGQDVSEGIAFADLDGDDFPDIFVANKLADNQIWLNDGTGQYSWDSQVLDPAGDSRDVALADLDDDGDIDAFVANNGANNYFVNDGNGGLLITQSLGTASSLDVILGDVDGDLDLDVYVTNGGTSFAPDELWLNEMGELSTSGQSLSGSWNEGGALADLDGDDDLDLYLASWDSSDEIWLNDGNGLFTMTNQLLSQSGSLDVKLMDVDEDNDVDAIVAKWVPGSDEIWLNNGSGLFSLSPQSLDSGATHAIAIGDLDGDFDSDLIFGNFGANGVWLKGGIGLPEAWMNVVARVNPAGLTVYPWAQPGSANLPIELGGLPLTPLDVFARLESPAGIMTETVPFGIGQLNSNLLIPNPNASPSQTMTVTLSVANSRTPGVNRHNPLHLTFIDSQAGDEQCILCFADWLIKLLGFETSFWTLHHMQLPTLRQAPVWSFYQGQFGIHSAEMSDIIARNPILMWQMVDMLESWTPAIQSVDDGQGHNVLISQEMVDDMVNLSTDISVEASPQLATMIHSELNIIDLPSFVGQPIDDLVSHVEGRVQAQIYLPVVRTP